MGARRVSKPAALELRDHLAAFLDDIAYRSNTGAGERHYTGQLRPLAEFMEAKGVRHLEDVSPDHLRAYMRSQREATYSRRTKAGEAPVIRRLSPASVRHRYNAARTFFAWCVDDGRLALSPMSALRPPKGEQRAREGFSREDQRALVEATSTAKGMLRYRDRAIVLMGIDVGARAGEICALQIADIDWNRHLVTLHGKNSEDRRLRMGRSLEKALRDWLTVRPPVPFQHVFVTQRMTPLSVRTLWAMMRNLGLHAQVDHAHTHRLRHTFAAEFTRTNRDVYATKARLGHKKLATTERYLHSLGVDYGLDATYRTPGENL